MNSGTEINMHAAEISVKEINQQIYALRDQGELKKAIDLCTEVIKQFPQNDFYPMVAGDLYLSIGDYKSAMDQYIDYYKKMPDSAKLFGQFVKRYYRLKKLVKIDDFINFNFRIYYEAQGDKISRKKRFVSNNLVTQSLEKVPLTRSELNTIELLDNDKNFNLLTKKLKEIDNYNSLILELILDKYILDRKRSFSTFKIDSYCISIYEKYEKLVKALKICEELVNVKADPILVRTLFRICRKLHDYSKAEIFIKNNPRMIGGGDFNVGYELVYYYEYINDLEKVESLLRRIEKTSADSIPIQKTLRNFYLRFGLLEDANRVSLHIAELFSERGEQDSRFSDELYESEVEVGSKIKELYSEVEHRKQLTALCDLTTGISHELGQPVTNIRYTIQFYKKIFEKNINKDDLFKVLDSILEETKRMGGLVSRLSPITSSRSINQNFDVMDRIRLRINAESGRLKSKNIIADVLPSESVLYYGDPSKFDQVISNLLINSIDSFARSEKKGVNRIHIIVNKEKDKLEITFTDTGEGIPAKNRGKIFDPFFTTKPPGKGEGLGLFIVWNIIKYFGGDIKLDNKYRNGAKFNIILPTKIHDTGE